MTFKFPGTLAEKLSFTDVWNQDSKSWELQQIPRAYDGDLNSYYNTAWDGFAFLAFDLGSGNIFVSGIQIKYAGGGKHGDYLRLRHG